jgi:hypothetical protein
MYKFDYCWKEKICIHAQSTSAIQQITSPKSRGIALGYFLPYNFSIVISSPELKAQVSFSDRPLSGVSLSVRLSFRLSCRLSVRL